MSKAIELIEKYKPKEIVDIGEARPEWKAMDITTVSSQLVKAAKDFKQDNAKIVAVFQKNRLKELYTHTSLHDDTREMWAFTKHTGLPRTAFAQSKKLISDLEGIKFSSEKSSVNSDGHVVLQYKI